MTDSRYALRGLLHAPTYTIAAITTLALGTGIIAAVSSVVVASLRPLPVVAAVERLVMIKPTRAGRLLIESALAEDDLDALRRASPRSIGPPAGFGFFQAALSGASRSTIVKGEAVFGDYFPLLGVQPVIGRLLSAADDDRHDTLVISERLWKEWYAADPGVVGRPVHLGGRPFTIVGVVPATFWGLHGGHLLGNDVWVPRAAVRQLLASAHLSANTFARLTAGYTTTQADGSLRAVRLRTEAASQRTLAAIPFEHQFTTSPVAVLSVGTVVAGLSILVLAASCGNLTSLLLARVMSRHGELAIRLMLGARQRELLRLLMLEVGIIVAAAAVLGGVLANWPARLLSALAIPAGRGLVVRVAPAPDWWLLAALSLAALAGATILMWVLGRQLAHVPSLVHTASAVGLAGSTIRYRRLRQTITVAQIAVSVLALTLTALFGRGMATLLSRDLPPNADRIAVAWFDYGMQGATNAEAGQLTAGLLTAGAAVHGVTRVSVSSDVPGARRGRAVNVRTDEGLAGRASLYVVSPGYFETFGYALRDGSTFAGNSVQDIVVNEAAASRWWPGERAIGRQVILTTGQPATALRVVGVVSDPSSLSGTGPVVLQPLSSASTPSRVVLAVSSSDGAVPVAAIISAAKGVSGTLAPYDVRTLRQELTGGSTHLEAGAGVAGALALVACILSLTGLYGTVAHLSGRRTREFAVRMACGASTARIYRLIAREQGVLIVMGLGAGVLVAGAVARVLAGYFNGLPAFDWWASIMAPLVLGAICMIAALAPVRAIVGTGALRSLRD